MTTPRTPITRPLPPGVRDPENSGINSTQNELRFVVYRTATGGIEGVYKVEPELSTRQSAILARVREIPPGAQLGRYRVVGGRITRV